MIQLSHILVLSTPAFVQRQLCPVLRDEACARLDARRR